MTAQSKSNPLLDFIVNNPEAFAQNLAKMAENGGKALAAYLEPRETKQTSDTTPEDLANLVKSLSPVAEYWMKDPSRAIEAQTRLWSGYMNIWNNTLKTMVGDAPQDPVLPDPKDKRFKDEQWQQGNFFNFLMQMYLLTSDWAQNLVEEADELDDHTRRKAAFYMRQLAAAMSPSNFVLTNPELLQETLGNNAENLVDGLDKLAEDIRAGHGHLRIRQTDQSKFTVGENIATTPGTVILRNELCELIQYAPSTQTALKRPLLVIPPWINKYYILDLNEEKSWIKWAVSQGHTVFVISWVNPDETLAHKTFEDYMRQGVLECAEKLQKVCRTKEINAVGYCVGGTLLAATLAYLAKQTEPSPFASATFLTTQVDFTEAGELQIFVDEEQLSTLEARMQAKGYLEGSKMANAFNMLRANDLIWPYVVNNYIRGQEPFPFDLLYWNSDSTRMTSACHSFYLRSCYLNNELASGTMQLAGETLQLHDITIPVFHLATKEDHIAPATSVFKGAQLLGGECEFVLSGSGHIAGVVNPPHKQKYQYWTGPAPHGSLDSWQENAKEHAGSWWPHWQQWITSQDPQTVKARKPSTAAAKKYTEAPGTYVKVRY
ncbi:PHA/PHB synthase family protein [Polycladidibacter hongkongensis]|uniref:PHA/PHB synthase family protein n=1 Tax=Polycladidibacter hongkongensis TaxID=1647556 RepID=UPI0008337197|nr:class I poly(R)-hydroxyalkanoic acid synthase [Pseudovibrio hongkongensis]